MKIMIGLMLVAFGALAVDGAPVSVFDSQDITEENQYFEFTFDNLPENNGGGALSFNVSGDFSDNIASEYVEFTLGSVNGSLRMDESGVLANTIAGLSLTEFSSHNVLDRYDETFQADFFATSSLLDMLLADDVFVVTAQNGSGVTPGYALGQFGSDPDYIEVGLGYESIPEPSTLGLLGVCTFGLLGIRGRRKFYWVIMKVSLRFSGIHFVKKTGGQYGPHKTDVGQAKNRSTTNARRDLSIRINF